ncbi:transcriptional regulator, AraC family [Kribbella flavida DSM 17836]|uniref:Transcriptional regulator, AraC family n=1 Tax=Kribbella flavida (strain DSM 17836 / JCM 10339 / NBRC 14399) TaxID=479435 RepID=D2PTH7_KRIFD|nr:AraC family transcriptional regulator [Kribbella flavida]ADB31290.1 transcriptional regulator, AraC family [Kribbella flavida DSM 17836]
MDVLSDVLAALRTGRPHAARTQAEAPWGIRFPPSDSAGCHVLLEGSCWLIPARGEPIQLAVGDVVFVPHGTGYALADRPGSPLVDFQVDADDAAVVEEMTLDGTGTTTRLLCAAYYFDRASSHPLLDELPEVVHLPLRLGQHASLRAAVDLLGAELSEPRAGTSAILSGLVDMLLLFVLRGWFDEQVARSARPDVAGSASPAGWASVLGDPALTAALHGIHARPEHPWTVSELAALSGLSRATFAKRFAGAVGRSPLAYLTWWRMTLAARRLRDSDDPLRTIATRTGYATEFALAKAFKREYGVAPGQYRRQSSELLPA